MTPEQTSKAYDQIAEHWDDAEFDRSNGIEQHKRALMFVSQFGSALDVGCGSSGRIIEILLRNEFIVEGLDISKEMLVRAKRRHPNVCFHLADICTWKFSTSYDFISAWDSTWHIPLDRQFEVLRKLCSGLSKGGVLIFTTGGVDLPNEVTNPCFGHPLYHSAPGIPALLRTLEECDCSCRHLEYDGGYPDKHVYVIAQKS